MRKIYTFCDDINEGGIEGCQKYFNDGDSILCLQYGDRFFYSKIIKFSENYELNIYCQKLSLDNYCTKCINIYILLNFNLFLKNFIILYIYINLSLLFYYNKKFLFIFLI